ncbi:MAG: electron transfer flavoprotein subunit beta [Syntrophus sp. (in: bacteria)]|nr:electron transfer flavoprotein subunit beta [Syntrophus sp. (in: bacteria)]
MKILVFIKHVADTEARILISSDKKTLEIENKYTMSFFDEFAVEEALRIKEKLKEGQVVVCTFGNKKAIEALRTAVAMGADSAFLIDNTDMENDDPMVNAKVLSGFAKREGFDLILCGRQAIDDENACLGPMIAEFLDIPHVSTITKLEIIEIKKILVESEIEGGTALTEVQLPALLTVQKGLNEPRVPLITGVMKAMKTAVPVVDPSEFGIIKNELNNESRTYVLSYEPPSGRPPVKIVEGEAADIKVKNLIELLRNEARAI